MDAVTNKKQEGEKSKHITVFIIFTLNSHIYLLVIEHLQLYGREGDKSLRCLCKFSNMTELGSLFSSSLTKTLLSIKQGVRAVAVGSVFKQA